HELLLDGLGQLALLVERSARQIALEHERHRNDEEQDEEQCGEAAQDEGGHRDAASCHTRGAGPTAFAARAAICVILATAMRHALCILCLILCGSARAVIVYGDDPGYATPSGAGTGWDYVGTIVGGSGVFLGNYAGSYWVLTAGHVGAGTFTLGGMTYAE